MTKTLTTERLREIAERRSPSLRWGEAEQIADECLANREAQPVGFYTTVSGKSGVIWYNGAPDDDTAIYTAPPAPAVVKLPTEFYSNEGVVVRLEEVMAALALVGVKYERKGNACRAAMLAQPVSQGYKLVPVEPTEDMQIAAREWSRRKYGRPIGSDASIGCYEAMLAAAPEGGNEK